MLPSKARLGQGLAEAAAYYAWELPATPTSRERYVLLIRILRPHDIPDHKRRGITPLFGVREPPVERLEVHPERVTIATPESFT